ncbi:uncharacterized protein VP01_1528g3 [Puccinia sorghi]|uniref:DUF4219 domain-containing protein n=1 Tax=Puccinia sorghi TaxID=27349 RepID=A0A0L6VKG4_9BASI|nr:uncharacterized protein VP01_1528g3 [Puccinia sorghi]
MPTDHDKYQVPELTADNFVDWIVKMKSVLKAKELYQLVIGKEPVKGRGDDGKVVDLDHSLRLDKAHALIITRIHSSISGRVRKNGGDECPKKLWSNIIDFGASKKQANVFKAWYRLMHLPLRANNVQSFTSQFWDGIAVLQSLDASIDDNILGHIILMKIPNELSHVRNSLIASGTSSLIEVTYEVVLEMLDNQVKADSTMPIANSTSKEDQAHDDSATALLTQRCPPGRHLASSSHTASRCFSLHPELLKKYRDQLNDRINDPEAHFTSVSSIDSVHESSIASPDPFSSLLAQAELLTVDEVSEGHESEVSLL